MSAEGAMFSYRYNLQVSLTCESEGAQSLWRRGGQGGRTYGHFLEESRRSFPGFSSLDLLNSADESFIIRLCFLFLTFSVPQIPMRRMKPAISI
jgi:hypothetical protein